MSLLLSLLVSRLQPWLILGRGMRLPRTTSSQIHTHTHTTHTRACPSSRREESETVKTGQRKRKEVKWYKTRRGKVWLVKRMLWCSEICSCTCIFVYWTHLVLFVCTLLCLYTVMIYHSTIEEDGDFELLPLRFVPHVVSGRIFLTVTPGLLIRDLNVYLDLCKTPLWQCLLWKIMTEIK